MSVTFSSSVLVDDATTATSRFTSFDLEEASAQVLASLQDDSATRYALSFAGSGLREAQSSLVDIAVVRLANGEPDVTLGGVAVAAAIGSGELVTVSFDLYNTGETSNKETVTRTGVITNLVWSGGPGGALAQRLDLVLHVCDRLVRRDGGTVTVLSKPSS